MNNIVKKVISDKQEGKVYTAEVITDENIDDMFEHPEDYVDYNFDIPIIKLRDSNSSITVFLGVDLNDKTYITLEDDEVSEDFYPSRNESLWDVYKRALSDWKVGE